MSSIDAPGDAEVFHVVVAEDGSLPARELARLGRVQVSTCGLSRNSDRLCAREWLERWRPPFHPRLSML